jgi:hypothetical protein
MELMVIGGPKVNEVKELELDILGVDTQALVDRELQSMKPLCLRGKSAKQIKNKGFRNETFCAMEEALYILEGSHRQYYPYYKIGSMGINIDGTIERLSTVRREGKGMSDIHLVGLTGGKAVYTDGNEYYYREYVKYSVLGSNGVLEQRKDWTGSYVRAVGLVAYSLI